MQRSFVFRAKAFFFRNASPRDKVSRGGVYVPRMADGLRGNVPMSPVRVRQKEACENIRGHQRKTCRSTKNIDMAQVHVVYLEVDDHQFSIWLPGACLSPKVVDYEYCQTFTLTKTS